jgi:hypothetical protein
VRDSFGMVVLDPDPSHQEGRAWVIRLFFMFRLGLNFKCFVITKTSFRGSFGEKLYCTLAASIPTPHFNIKCFVITKTFLRRSLFGEKLYITSFSSSLVALNFKSKEHFFRSGLFHWDGLCNLDYLIWKSKRNKIYY